VRVSKQFFSAYSLGSMMMAWTIVLYAALLLSSVEESTSFAPVAFGGLPHKKCLTTTAASKVVLAAKKTRRRKIQPTDAVAPDPIKVSPEKVEGKVDDVEPDDIAKGECKSRLQ
jgi:hypothetical protein